MPVAGRSAPTGEGGFPLGAGSILQGIGVAFLAALGFAAAVGLAVAWTPQWDAPDALYKGFNLLATLAGGFAAGRRAKRLGWLHGGLAGIGYMLLAAWILAPGAMLDPLVTSSGLASLAYGFLAGALGGVLGRLL